MRSLAIGTAVALCSLASLWAQESDTEISKALREKAIVLNIMARVVEQDQTASWSSESSRITIPGRPVSIKLMGTNIAVVVQFTPYTRADGKQVLVAQCQLWASLGTGPGVRYQTTMQTIPFSYGEKIFFFPLGARRAGGNAHIEMELELNPWTESTQGAQTTGQVQPVQPSMKEPPEGHTLPPRPVAPSRDQHP